MKRASNWRGISAEEAAVIVTIVDRSGLSGCGTLIAQLSEAMVSPQTPWILDIVTAHAGSATTFADGPFPARALVPSHAEYRGEVIIWISAGRISGLEYAWVTDDPPKQWPLPEEIEVVSE